MKTAATFTLFCLMLAWSGCNYAKPMMYIDVANQSGHPLLNVEVKYPSRFGGSDFGVPELDNQTTHRQMVPLAAPCRFSVEFDDKAGKHYAHNFDLGAKCPPEVYFAVGGGMTVNQWTATP